MDSEVANLRKQVAAAKTRLEQLKNQQQKQLAAPKEPPQHLLTSSKPRRIESATALAADAHAASLEAAQEHARRYRLTGWSCWEVELNRGRWAVESAEGKPRKGLAVRIETYWRGRFYEPYYVVFATPVSLPPNGIIAKSAKERVASKAKGKEKAPGEKDVDFIVAHSTIPHFLPLEDLEAEYLSGQDADIELFLTRLTTLLQAYVSRRQQLDALSSALSSRLPEKARCFIDRDEACLSVQMGWSVGEEAEGKEVLVDVTTEGLASDVFTLHGRGSGVRLIHTPSEKGSLTTRIRQHDLERKFFPRRITGSWLTGELHGLDEVVTELAGRTRSLGRSLGWT